MTADEFRQLAMKLFGPGPGWKSRCADALGTDRSNVTRWLSGVVPTIPGPVAAAMRCWAERREQQGSGA